MTLDEVRDDVFRRLARGVADRRSPFRTPALVTAVVTAQATTRTTARAAERAATPASTPVMGGNVRTVVLRSWDVPSRTLTIHSDVRAQKMVEIAALPAVALHVWDAGSQIQVRLWGQAHVVGPDEAAAAWARLHPGSRASYRAALVPGTPVLDPATLPLLDEEAARQNFAVLAVMVMGMEWLHLGRDGHRRARFAWTMDGMAPDEGATAGLAPDEAAWLVP